MSTMTAGHYRMGNATFAAAFLAGLTCIAIAIALIPGKAQPVGYVAAPLCALVTWRLWRLGAHTERNGVKIVGYVASRTIPWERIDHFEVLPFHNYPYAGHVVLKGGSEVLVPGLEAGRPKSDRGYRKVRQKVDELNQELAGWRSGQFSAAGDGESFQTDVTKGDIK